MRVLERGLLTLDHLYYQFFYSMHLQGSMKQRKTANCKQFIIISVHYQK